MQESKPWLTIASVLCSCIWSLSWERFNWEGYRIVMTVYVLGSGYCKYFFVFLQFPTTSPLLFNQIFIYLTLSFLSILSWWLTLHSTWHLHGIYIKSFWWINTWYSFSLIILLLFWTILSPFFPISNCKYLLGFFLDLWILFLSLL